MKTFIVFLVAIVAVSSVMAATITVKKDGSGDVASVAMALAGASNGDTIIIADSEVYEEDLTAGAAAGLAASFTLKAAEGQTPTIRATNTMERLDALGIPGTDYMGALFFGCQGVLIEGITFENLSTEMDAGGISGVLSIFDCSDTTIRNCTIHGAGGDGTGYPGDNLNLIIAGVQTAPVGIVVENCISEDGNYAIAISKLQGGTPTDPSTIVRDCIFRNCEATGIEVDDGAPPDNSDPNVATGQGNLFENCTVINCDGGIGLGGGYNVVRNCTVLSCRSQALEVNLDGDRGTQPITAIVENSDFVGSLDDGVRVDEGIVNLTNCIVAGNGSEGLHLRDTSNLTTVTMDHCDIYKDLQENDFYEVRVDPGSSDLIQLHMSNTNVVSEIGGVYNGNVDDPTFFDEEGLFASYCNVVASEERFTNVVVDNDLEVDPKYVNPTNDPELFTREGFQLAADSALLAAGDGGTYIGSQGTGAPVSVVDWSIY